MKKQRITFSSLLQAGCSALLLIGCLLPWLNITSSQESLSGQFNMINMPLQSMNEAGEKINVPMPQGSVFDYYSILLYLILLFVFINVFIQFIKKTPLFTCYSCIIPTFFSYLCWSRVTDCGSDLNCAGIGLYLANIFGTIAIAAAWTDLGRYYSVYQKTFRFCWIWSITSLTLPILFIFIGNLLRIQSSGANVIYQLAFVLMIIGSIIWAVGILQIPLLIYATIVNHLTQKKINCFIPRLPFFPDK